MSDGRLLFGEEGERICSVIMRGMRNKGVIGILFDAVSVGTAVAKAKSE